MSFTQDEVKAELIRRLEAGEITREQAKQAADKFKASQVDLTPDPQTLQPQEQGFAESLTLSPEQQALRQVIPSSSGAPQGQTSGEDATILAQQADQGVKDAFTSITDTPSQVSEAFTGAQRTTPEIEGTTDWVGLPELNAFTGEAAKAVWSTMLTGPEETMKILKANFPDLQIRQDSKGNYIFRSSIDGKDYGYKPGFRVSDIPRAIVGGMELLPAKRGLSLAGTALRAGGTEAIHEGSQALSGGDFDPLNVATAGVVAPALKVAGDELGSLRKVDTPEPIGPQGIADELTTPKQETQFAKEAVKAARKPKKQAKFAEMVQADPDVIESAKRLDVLEDLQPDHLSNSLEYRKLQQLAKSQSPGGALETAEQQGLQKVGDRAIELVEKMKGTKNLGGLSDEIEAFMSKDVKRLEVAAEKAYSELNEEIPKGLKVKPNITLKYLEDKAKKLGGPKNLSGIDKRVYNKIMTNKGQPTYHLLDEIRKEVGAKTKLSEAFGDADKGKAKALYSTITGDQEKVANSISGSKWKDAKALVEDRKEIEDQMKYLFGRDLSKEIGNKIIASNTALSKTDLKKFNNLIKSVPKEFRQEVVASAILQTFGGATKMGDLNFNTFSKWHKGLSSNPAAKNALYANLPKGAGKTIEDIAKVAEYVNKSLSEKIHTGRAMADYFKKIDSFMGQAMSIIGRGVAIGAPAEAIYPTGGALVAGIIGSVAKGGDNAMEKVTNMVTDKRFMNLAVEAAEKKKLDPDLVKKFSASRGFKAFYNEAKKVIKPKRGDLAMTPERFIISLFNATNTEEETK